MNQAFHLARLQKIDLQIDQITARLKEIERLLRENKAVQEAEQVVKESDAAAKKAGQQLKKTEDAVNSQRIKIETNESSLYAGKIHNPKELQDLQNDIASLKRYLAVLEDQQLDAMQAVEDTDSAYKRSQADLARVQGQFLGQSAALSGERTRLSDDLQRLSGERQAALIPISPESLALYQRLRDQKKGLAVARVDDGACSGCGTELRPAEVQAARSPHSIAFCSSCGRILYSG
ncbi:MAG TPA: C4-type zinc ribbon domain-containing protein [Anaerolineaceae bacterium]|nr:C4-type zinc ribbon domain-containing protein [Anaerolineaceae bacterium]